MDTVKITVWASLPFVEGLGTEGAKEGYLGFLVATPQLAMHPLPQFYEEWCFKCTLSEWIDRVSPPLKQVLFLQNIPHTNHQVINGPGSAGQLVHHQHKGQG